MNQELIKQLSKVTEVERDILVKGKTLDKEKIMKYSCLSVNSKEMLNAGNLIQVIPRLRFVNFPVHRRNYIHGIYSCKGQTSYFLNDQQIHLKEGELLFLSPNTERKIAPAKEEDLAVEFIILPEFFDLSFYVLGEEENLLREFLVSYLRGENPPNNYLYFQVADIVPIQNLLENMVWAMFSGLPCEQVMIQTSMRLLFMLLSSYTGKLETKGHSFEQRLHLDVLRYIDEHYREGSLKELCQKLGFDVYWMSRMIKKLTGKNYKELLQIRRLNQAAYMLLKTKDAVAEISISVGYDNTSYFHRIFREYYGVSPKEYRNEHKR